MTEIRVPGVSRFLISCIRDFPPGCGPNAVFVDLNPNPQPDIVIPAKPVENGIGTHESNSQISVPSDVVVDAVPLSVVEREAVSDVLSDVGKRQIDFVNEGALIIDNAQICDVKAEVEGAVLSDGVSPSVISGEENAVVASEPAGSLSFSDWKEAAAVTDDVGMGKDGCEKIDVDVDVDMDVVSDGKGKEVVAVAGSLKEAVGLNRPECPKNGLGQMEVQDIVQRDMVDGTRNVGKEWYPRKYPPPRAVSAVRDFPIGCGPNSPLQSGKECLRSGTELVLSKGKKHAERSLDVADQKPAQGVNVPAEVPVNRVEERDKTNEDSSSRSKTSSVGVPMIGHQAADLAICQAIPNIPLDQIEKWNDETKRRENATKRVSHEAPVQHLNLEKHRLPNTKSEFGSKSFVAKGKITARKSIIKLSEKSDKDIGIKKRKFNDGVKHEHGMINEDLDYPKMDDNEEKYIVQGLMAAQKCPWRLTQKQGASSSRSPYVKVKRKEATDTKQLALNEIEDEEPYGKVKRKDASNAKKLAFSRMKDEKPHVEVKTREKSETKIAASNMTDDEEDTTFQDAETERSPVTPASLASEDMTARQKVKWVLEQFNSLFRKYSHEAESNPNKSSGRMRIDIMVADELKKMGAFVNRDSKGIVGDVPGVEVGDEFVYRVELAIIGLHRGYQAGIDYAKIDGMNIALSIVSSGGYQDDMENSDELTYTGSGGKAASAGKEAEDQKLERGNLALKNSIDKRTPVRVIHGFKEVKAGLYGSGKSKAVSTLTYAGLYNVVNCWQEKGKDDYFEYKFKLVRLPGQPELALHQVKQSKKSEVR